MKKLQTLIAASFLCISSTAIYAAPDNVPGGDVPPAQMQKDNVPNSTENGNYLEPQPSDASTDANATSKHKSQKDSKKDKMHKDKLMKDKKMGTEGKNTTEDPASGGADVKTN